MVSPRLVKLLALKPEKTRKVVTVVNGEKSNVLGKVLDVRVIFEKLEARLDLVVLQNAPFDLVIGR